MSTYYYDLKEPWTGVEVDENQESYVIRLWDGRKHQAGVLTLTVDEGREAIYSFFRDEPVCQTCADGQGPVLHEFRKARTNTLLSDYGDIVTLDEINNKCHRRDNELPEPESGASV